MLHPPSKHVTFVYTGPLQTRGRLLKQIRTLQRAGVTCDLVLGDTAFREAGSAKADFPVTSFPVDIDGSPLRSFVETLKFCRRAAGVVARSNADTVVCLALGALMAGKWAKDLRGDLRLVYDNNELQIESIPSRMKRVIWNHLQNKGLKASDVIFHAESNRLRYFQKHYPVATGIPQVLVENFPFYTEVPEERQPPADEVRVVYLGGFGDGRFTEEIIEAFSGMDPKMRLDIVGFGRPAYVEALKSGLRERKVDHVRILPGIPHSSIPAFLKDYHIGVALYRNTNLNNYYCAPNKVYDYLMNGMPVITNDYPGLLEVIEANKAGACIPEVNAGELRKAIERIVAERRWENITGSLRKRYTWEAQEPGYLEAFGLATESD
jgi:glycosyltransferase involved in cell wall biosynthesis